MSIKRKLAVTVLGLLCLVTGYGAMDIGVAAYRESNRLAEARAERPATFTLDLAVTNQVTALLLRKHDLGHGMEVWLQVPGSFTNVDEARTKLAGMSGFLSANLSGGGGGYETFTNEHFVVSQLPELAGMVMLGRLGGSATGHGRFDLEVVSGTPELMNVRARGLLLNSYCGIEHIRVTAYWVMTLGCALIALVCWWWARWLYRNAPAVSSVPIGEIRV